MERMVCSKVSLVLKMGWFYVNSTQSNRQFAKNSSQPILQVMPVYSVGVCMLLMYSILPCISFEELQLHDGCRHGWFRSELFAMVCLWCCYQMLFTVTWCSPPCPLCPVVPLPTPCDLMFHSLSLMSCYSPPCPLWPDVPLPTPCDLVFFLLFLSLFCLLGGPFTFFNL